MQFLNPQQIMDSARNAIKPALMLTMGGTVLGAVLLFGLFGMEGEIAGAGSLLGHFIGGLACLFWVLFGLTALAHQLHMQVSGQPIPGPAEAAGFVWSRLQPLIQLPVWAAGVLLALLLGEVMLLVLARIPGLGLLWLVIVGVPILLLNTVIAILLLLAVFNIAARVAISEADTDALRDALWRLLRHRLPEVLIYNLGGVVASLLVAAVVLSPLWLGAQMTWSLMDLVGGEQVARVQAAAGFWGGLAHLLALLLFGALLSVVAGVPGIVITDLTLRLHMELAEGEAEAGTTIETGIQQAEVVEEAEKPGPRRRAPRKRASAKSSAAKRTTKQAAPEGNEAAGDAVADDQSGDSGVGESDPSGETPST